MPVAASALKDADPFVRRRAAEALVRQGLAADKPPFAPVADVYALLNDADRFVRYSGRMALERTPRAEWAPMVAAETNPLGAIEGALALVETAKSDADLERLPAQVVDGPLVGQSRSAREAIERLRQIYCGSIGYEFDHVQDAEQRNWLRDAAETGAFHQPLDAEQKKALLQRLTEVEAFEKFLHTTYLGAKRFSVDLTRYPTLMRIFDACMGLDAFDRAQPSKQPDFEP